MQYHTQPPVRAPVDPFPESHFIREVIVAPFVKELPGETRLNPYEAVWRNDVHRAAHEAIGVQAARRMRAKYRDMDGLPAEKPQPFMSPPLPIDVIQELQGVQAGALLRVWLNLYTLHNWNINKSGYAKVFGGSRGHVGAVIDSLVDHGLSIQLDATWKSPGGTTRSGKRIKVFTSADLAKRFLDKCVVVVPGGGHQLRAIPMSERHNLPSG